MSEVSTGVSLTQMDVRDHTAETTDNEANCVPFWLNYSQGTLDELRRYITEEYKVTSIYSYICRGLLEAKDVKKLHIAVIGPSGQGKTSLVKSWQIACKQFKRAKFVEVVNRTRTHESEGITKTIKVWDTIALDKNDRKELDNLISGDGYIKTIDEFTKKESEIRERMHMVVIVISSTANIEKINAVKKIKELVKKKGLSSIYAITKSNVDGARTPEEMARQLEVLLSNVIVVDNYTYEEDRNEEKEKLLLQGLMKVIIAAERKLGHTPKHVSYLMYQFKNSSKKSLRFLKEYSVILLVTLAVAIGILFIRF